MTKEEQLASDQEFADKVLRFLWRTQQMARTGRGGVTANTTLRNTRYPRDENGRKIK